ncbi:MAG: RNA 2',3'-cyclic phosphodiesterase, partial [Candidatus Moranbacteria bacterium]|nr:RNA 2',3'-cyclic phosphodiesterase [Candidatus Moranbacteria bacterium]
MRLFIGIELTPIVQEELYTLQNVWLSHALKKNPTRYDNFHLTLLFLGELDPHWIDPLIDQLSLSLSSINTFDLTIGDVGSFVRGDKHIIWVGVKQSQPLKSVYNAVKRAVNDCEITVQDARFTPHITLAREVLFRQDYEITLPFIQVSQPVTHITLFLSQRKNGELIYT